MLLNQCCQRTISTQTSLSERKINCSICSY